MQDVPYGYCHCGCGRKTKIAAKTNTAQHQRKGYPNRYIAGHHGPQHPDYLEEDRGHETPCWIWQGGLDRDGYGLAGWLNAGRRSSRPAHGHYYEKLIGPIPDGLELDHLCRVRACVNPGHLEPVSHDENVRRGLAHRTIQTHCKRGHPFDDENTYRHPNGRRICRTCRRAHLHAYYYRRKARAAEPKPDRP